MFLEPPRSEHRRQRETDQERKEGGNNDRQAELLEEASDVASDKADRRKDHDIEQCDCNCCQADL